MTDIFTNAENRRNGVLFDPEIVRTYDQRKQESKMTEIKSYPLEAVLSIVTGKSLCQFNQTHELAEWIAGHPIWTHEFADAAVWDKLRKALFAVHPELSSVDGSHITRDNWQYHLAAWKEVLCETYEVPRGTGERTEDPVTSATRMMNKARCEL